MCEQARPICWRDDPGWPEKLIPTLNRPPGLRGRNMENGPVDSRLCRAEADRGGGIMHNQDQTGKDRSWWPTIVAALIGAAATIVVGLIASGAGVLHITVSPAPTHTVFITPSPAVTATTRPSGATGTSANGDLLGSYTFRLGQYTSAPLGATAPTQAQILANSGDIVWNTGSGGSPLQPGSGEQFANLPSGTTPTYQACKADTVFSNTASPNPGTAFCIIETTGKMAGVTVASANLTQSPYYLNLHVAVWANSS